MNTLNIVAHPDDDLLFLNPDILTDFENNREPYLLYLTTGDDGRDKPYVLKRVDAVQYAWGPRMAGRQIFWNIKSNCFRNGDKLGDLYRMYRDSEYQASSFYQNETYNREWFIKSLQALANKIQPGIIRLQDPFSEPAIEADGPNLDHIDHIYGAKLVVMSLWNAHSDMFAYQGYSIRHLESNVPTKYVEKKTEYWRRYQEMDTEVAGAIWDEAMTRCYWTKI